MYLKVVNGTKSKEYMLTSQYNEKPYMIVSGTNKLPLTTKPPLDYATHSESGTFYTTAENPDNLRETTALTRQSIYETVYGTRASTYNTVYGTVKQARSSARWYSDDYDHLHDSYAYGYYYVYNISGYHFTSESLDGDIYYDANFSGDPLTIKPIVGDAFTKNTYWNAVAFPSVALQSYKTVTTGTTYLTRASTSATSYLTQSSASAYQGVSSTSSSTSYDTNPGSNIYIKISKETKTYRPLEYKSSSESASMYTTVGEDEWYLLSETTALTRESTSKTVYNTRASTSKTIYGTRREARSSARIMQIYDDDYYYTTVSNISRSSWSAGYSYTVYYGDPVYVNGVNRGAAWGGWGNYGNVSFQSYKTFTTGTTYQTRASTYQTVYQTRESTSAYSGISSSSQSTMSWV